MYWFWSPCFPQLPCAIVVEIVSPALLVMNHYSQDSLALGQQDPVRLRVQMNNIYRGKNTERGFRVHYGWTMGKTLLLFLVQTPNSYY